MEKEICNMIKNYPIVFILLGGASLSMAIGLTHINQILAILSYGLAIIFQCFALYFAIKNKYKSKKEW